MPPDSAALASLPLRRIFTVTELTRRIRGIFDDHFADVWVAGEISNAKLASSGHLYFVLKDQNAQLRCACFRNAMRYLKFQPADGLAVLARGRIDVYEARGEYQLIVEMMEPQGYGALQLAFEQLKARLEAEGLFAAGRKRPLPRIPRRIGIVTSPTGAVIRDMLKVFERRFPGLEIRLFPALVQGQGAVEEIVAGIRYFSESGWPDVVIVGRGGGSLEDLWSFNEEPVARAIAASSVPVISAVGHETDFTIADFVADLRAPTPSSAAELAIRSREEFLGEIASWREVLVRWIRYEISLAHRRAQERGMERASALLGRMISRRMQRTDDLEFRLQNAIRRTAIAVAARRLADLDTRLRRFDPRPAIERGRARQQRLETALRQAMAQVLRRRKSRLEVLEATLRGISPLTVLERGYAIVTGEDGGVLRSAEGAPAGAELGIRLAKGSLQAKVLGAKRKRRSPA